MSKKYKNLFIVFIILIIAIMILLIITQKKDNKANKHLFDNIKGINGINIVNKFNEIDLIKENSTWKSSLIHNLKINSNKVDELLNIIYDAKILKTIKSDNLKEYNLEEPDVAIKLTSDKKNEILRISYMESNNSYYIYSEKDNVIYVSKSDLFFISELTLLNFAIVDKLPNFNEDIIVSLQIKNDNNLITICNESKDALFASDEIPQYIIDNNKENINKRDIINFENKLLSLKLLNIIDYAASADNLSKFGLDKPTAKLSFENKNGNKIIMNIGYDFNEGNQTFVYFQNQNEEKYESLYLIYTIDSSLANYFINLSSADLDGSNNNEDLLDECLPDLKEDIINYISISNTNGSYTFAKDKDNVYKYINNNDNNEIGTVNTAFSEKLIKILCESRLFEYGDVLYDSSKDSILDNFGLLTSETSITISYKGKIINSSDEIIEDEIVWTMNIGNKYNDDYSAVHASNSSKIYLFNNDFVEFIKSIDKESFK